MLGDARCVLPLNSGKHQCFGLAFHTRVTLRIFDCAPPDTLAPDLWAVAFEYLQSIEGAACVCQAAPFCIGFYYLPRPYKLPRKKATSIKISVAPSIDGNCSKATSYKLDTPVSGGAYPDARKVAIEWNDI